jgi:hypothetical protein
MAFFESFPGPRHRLIEPFSQCLDIRAALIGQLGEQFLGLIEQLVQLVC